MLFRVILFLTLSPAFALSFSSAQEPKLKLEKGDHICIIGNTLAERMQHDGYLETYLHLTHPEHELTIRNLGFSADTLTTRLRSKDFGSPDEWLTKCKADVVFAFFGYNESWAGESGIPQFKKDLEGFVTHTLAQEYNGESAPKLVLFSPFAFLGSEQDDRSQSINAQLEKYSEVMREVASSKDILFVDLWDASSQLLSREHLQEKPSGDGFEGTSFNGVHLTSKGNAFLSKVICNQLQLVEIKSKADYETVRQPVLDKNWYWFHRYRTTDGYSTYGGRADLKFTDGQTNREVMDRELEILEWMTAERDKKIWAVAQGSDYVVDDSKSPEFIPVISNKPGPLEGGKHEFLSGEAAIEKMEVHEGMKVNLFASEEMFPELASPVQMAFDTKGRLWVAAWPSYPHWKPKDKMDDKLLIFEDTDGDGKADKMKVFADGLHNPTGFEFWNGGVFVAQAPDLWFLKDTDGDDVADVRERVLHGIDSADTHHTANSFVIGPGGGLYFQEGTFHHTQIETPWGPPVRSVNAGVFRYEPRTHKCDVYVAYGFANPHGHVFDRWGQDFVTDGTGNVNYYAAPFSGKVHYPYKHRNYFPFFKQWVRPSAATELISSKHFPEKFQGNYLIANVIGFQGLLQYQVLEDGSGFGANEVAPILKSSDPSFRPVDIEIGPDGAIYFLDWMNPIIGHMQHNLRDPNRDTEHGRVYRVTYEGRDLLDPPKIAGESIESLLELLKSPADRTRYQTRIELSGRDSDEVISATKKWITNLDPSDPNFEHYRLEGLWIHQHHDEVDADLLKTVFSSKEPRARAAAIRVLSYWHDRVEDSLEILAKAVQDDFARVRLEAVRACSYVDTAEAAEVALMILNMPTDKFLNYSLQETINVLEPKWKPFIASGEPFCLENMRGLRYVLERVDTFALTKAARSKPVFEELLSRQGVLHEVRHEAAEGLAKLNKTSAQSELLTAIERLDRSSDTSAQAVLADLAHIYLHGHSDEQGTQSGNHAHSDDDRTKLKNLAQKGRQAVTRQIAFATLINSEGNFVDVWNDALGSYKTFPDLLRAIPLIDDGKLRASTQTKLSDILTTGLPIQLAEQIGDKPGTSGRFVRIEIPGRRKTLTLAEVQVFSGSQNVALQGAATQMATRHGGTADKAIDGDNNGSFTSGTQTHTPENNRDPWWEVDLKSEVPIDKIVIWNRTDGDLGNRLNGYTIKILDENRQPVFEKKGNPAPKRSQEFAVAGDPVGLIERAAISSLPATGVDQTSSFELLSKLVLENKHRRDAIRSLSRLPKSSWVESQLKPLVESVIDRVSKVPAKDRVEPAILDELSLGKTLATALPRAEREKYTEAIGELGVNVIVLRPIPHKMQYDRSQIYVEAGKPVQIVLDNTDIMPHNVVITTPGAYAKVGIAAELMASTPDGVAKHFVPSMPEVLHASKMLQPGQVERLNIVAPQQPGEYTYVCTFPGHWRRMYGTMHVVPDLSVIPPEALAPTIDSEVAARPFVREWKLAELSGELSDAASGRSFEKGKALFAEMSCLQCHKVHPDDSEGGNVGPNLVDLLKKIDKGDMNREEILRSMVEPSHTIDDQYKTIIIQDIDGRVHSGVVAERTDEHLILLANPLDKKDPVKVLIDDIDNEIESKVSIMPIGLLNTMNKQEILDLLIYVESGGNEKAEVYK